VAGFTSETAARRFQKGNGRYETVSEVKRLQIYNGYMQRPFPNGHKRPFGCNGHVTAVTAGQSQRFYSGVGIFNWYYPSSPPQIPRRPGVQLESEWLKFLTASLPKRLRKGHFTSETETATWIQEWFKISVGTSKKLYLQ
jgi:hypothetical protein